MARLEDEDGIDGPFERGMRRAMREDRAAPPTCDPTEVECPTCGAWVGWACNGPRYGYHAAGYHRARELAARARRVA